MRKKLGILLRLTLAVALMATIVAPSFAELDGSMRSQMEFLDFSENMIRNGLYPKVSHDVFDRDKRAFVHGLPKQTAPIIYEPDVYTWELAMAEHKKMLAQYVPVVVTHPQPIAPLAPAPMSPPSMLPAAPAPIHLTPIAPQVAMESVGPLPVNAAEINDRMIYRARARGLHPGRPLRANYIKQRLVNHLNTLGDPNGIPALMPALPPGRSGDSCDAEF